MNGGITRTFKGTLLAAVIGLAAGTGVSQGSDTAGAGEPLAAFRALAGRWEGTNSRGESVRLVYDVLGGGSVVMERLTMTGESSHDMVTLYHGDGDRLMLTHYCVAGNQPRMRLVSLTDTEARFEFLDATGLPGPGAGHMHRAALSFEGPDTLASSWTWFEGGKEAFTEVIRVARTDTGAGR